jgi:hypothetical protein
MQHQSENSPLDNYNENGVLNRIISLPDRACLESLPIFGQ